MISVASERSRSLPVVIQGPNTDAVSHKNVSKTAQVPIHSKSKIVIVFALAAILAGILVFFYSNSRKEPLYTGPKISNPTAKGNSEGFAANGQQLTPGSGQANPRDSSHTYD